MAAPRLTQGELPKASGAERRSVPRIDIRASDGVSCTVTAGSEVLFVGHPYDLSIVSIALILTDDQLESFLRHEKFDFILEIAEQGKFEFSATVSVLKRRDDGTTKVAFLLEKTSAGGDVEVALTELGLLHFPPGYSISSFIYKPSFFYERTYVRIDSIAYRQLHVVIFDLETLLFPGMKIDLFMFDAALQLPPVKIIIRKVEKNSNGLIVAADVVHFPKLVAERVAQALIFDIQLSLEAVKKLGLPVPRISDGLRFRFIKSAEEYQEVLKLRFKAYQLAGKVAEGKTPADMAAPLDHLSRILVAYHGDKVVSSISIAFPDSEELILDTERAFPGGYPKKIPPKTECVEIARLCTDPDYRGSDLLLRVFEHTYKTLQCGGRKYILTSTDDKLWPLYKKLGFKKTGMNYAHPFLAGRIHHVIVVHASRAQTASGIDPLRWNYLYRDMNDHLLRRGVFKLKTAEKIRLGLFRWVGRILRIKTKLRS